MMQAKLHPFYVFRLPVAFFLLTWPFLVIPDTRALWAVLIVFVTLIRWLGARTTEYVVTNQRVIRKVGILSASQVEITRQKIEGVSVKQSLTGRIVGAGTVVVSGTGGAKVEFSHIRNPEALRLAVQSEA
ncbi:MAG: PH domain-containing protein [candidate division Zixibacteria bacterium]|nr:PH domain-containing protein [candidate division Zixibacteria bacterium]